MFSGKSDISSPPCAVGFFFCWCHRPECQKLQPPNIRL
nr:MAG TPA: hypothetical protein [Caudoviricetes sp.]